MSRGCRAGGRVPLAPLSILLFLFTFLVAQTGYGQQGPATGNVIVKGITVTGSTVFSIEQLAAITSSYLGQAMDLADLQHIAASVTEAYRQQGYTLASAYLPEQEIKEGVVEIAVLEGRVGSLTITRNKYYSTEFIKRGFTQVLDERVIKNSSLERSLLLLNEYPDLHVTATLEPGTETGTTNILAKAEDKRPLHASLDFNNYGFNTISRYRFGAGIEAGNVLFDGATLNLNGIIGNYPDQLLFVTGAYSVPIGAHGTKLVASGSGGKFNVGAELAALGIEGQIQTLDVSATHPFIKTRFQSLLAEFGFAAKDNRLTTLGTTSGDDHIRLLKLGFNYDRVDRRGRTFVSLYGFQGLGEALGGMQNNDPQATRQGADDRFTKATILAGRIESLGGDRLLILRGSGQVSTEPLVVIEQFLLGGPDSVRGYQLGERFVDEGFAVTAEVRVPFFPSVVPSTQIATFIDYGAGLLKNPAPGEQKHSSLTGTGVAMYTTLPYYDSTLRIDLGFPLGPTPIGGTLSGGRSPTVYLQAIARF